MLSGTIKKKRLFAATDHNGKYPFFYSNSNKNCFYAANSLPQISQHIKQLSINKQLLQDFSLGISPNMHTCYNEIIKLPAAHHLTVDKNGLTIKKYWQLENCQRDLKLNKRDDYYQAFIEIFSKSVSDCLQPDSPIYSHLSGGLDSSSVSAIAAQLLMNSNQKLHTITACPQALLTEQSYRKGWRNHETLLVQSLTQKYANITHHNFTSCPKSNVFDRLTPLYNTLDQPVRNVVNSEWFIGSLKFANSQNCKILLNGGAGNGTISWRGQSKLSKAKIMLKNIINRQNNNPHHKLIQPPQMWPRRASLYAIEQYHNVKTLDPTDTLPIKQFCYNVPQWVYRKGSSTLEQRLLVREGLAGIVPDPIRMNPYRGEQAPDWYLQYNHNIPDWQQQLASLSPEASEIIWNIYNKQNTFDLIKKYPQITSLDSTIVREIRIGLMRCLSAAFFCQHICNQPNIASP
ncbi:MAG: asparagine synthase-related protein [Coxiellaceae bacterium]|nr:asparagine synthase-related protein [Coxiellaceae bacterium]